MVNWLLIFKVLIVALIVTTATGFIPDVVQSVSIIAMMTFIGMALLPDGDNAKVEAIYLWILNKVRWLLRLPPWSE